MVSLTRDQNSSTNKANEIKKCDEIGPRRGSPRTQEGRGQRYLGRATRTPLVDHCEVVPSLNTFEAKRLWPSDSGHACTGRSAKALGCAHTIVIARKRHTNKNCVPLTHPYERPICCPRSGEPLFPPGGGRKLQVASCIDHLVDDVSVEENWTTLVAVPQGGDSTEEAIFAASKHPPAHVIQGDVVRLLSLDKKIGVQQ